VRWQATNLPTRSTPYSLPEASRAHMERGTSPAQDSNKVASLLVTCWYGAIVRRKSNPSLNLVEDLVPFTLTLLSLRP
jgi:hypothetical protein